MRRRPTDSRATCSARVPEPRTWADVSNNDVPSDGAPQHCPEKSSNPDAFAESGCFFTRNHALRVTTRPASTIQGHTTKMSLRANDGSRPFLNSSTKSSRCLAESNAQQMWRRKWPAAPSTHKPTDGAKPLSAHVSQTAVGGERRPTQPRRANHIPTVVPSLVWRNANTSDMSPFRADTTVCTCTCRQGEERWGPKIVPPPPPPFARNPRKPFLGSRTVAAHAPARSKYQ